MQPGASHFRTLGIFWVLYGIARFLHALWLIIHSNALTLMFGALLSRVPDPFYWMTRFHFGLAAMVVLTVVTGIVSLVAGLSLFAGGGSARTLGLVASFFGLIGGPLGIALGAFTVATLMPLA